ncbi:MAG TPA: DUF2631 domain-containing protein [Jatrophihabitans sp.]
MAHDSHSDHEQPSDWGWHGEFPKVARVMGWICVVILLLMCTATKYNHSGTMWLLISAGTLVVGLFWDVQRRRNAWRK